MILVALVVPLSPE